MNRRDFISGTAATGAIGVIAGCSQVNGLLGGGCGPGSVEIGTLPESVTGDDGWTADELPRVEGAVRSVGESSLLIDDGTGVARITALGGVDLPARFGEGDCLRARVIAAGAIEGGDADVEVTVADPRTV